MPYVEKGMQVGLFGGSFNPPHAGHALVAEIALRRLNLDQLWWIVTPGNPLKSTRELAPLAERIRLSEAVAKDPRIKVTAFEAANRVRYTADTLALVRGYGAPGSWLVFNYVDARVLQRAEGDQRITQRLAALVGEPHRYGFDPQALPAWLAAHGYVCRSDQTDLALAEQLLPPEAASAFASANRHIALTETRGAASESPA